MLKIFQSENLSKIRGKSETGGKMHHGVRGDGRPCCHSEDRQNLTNYFVVINEYMSLLVTVLKVSMQSDMIFNA